MLLALLAGGFFLAPPANASNAGDLDPTFGNQGRVLQPPRTRGLALTTAGGKLVVAGCYVSVSPDCKETAVARYHADGTPDLTFDGDGLAHFDFDPQTGDDPGTGREAATAVAMDGSGKIVIAGDIDGKFALARLNSDGSRDTTFGDQGIEFGPEGSARGLAFHDGKWVVAGVGNNSFTIARYHAATGDPDTFFDRDDPDGVPDGSKEVAVPGDDDGALGVVVHTSGIYAMGYATVAGPGNPVDEIIGGNDPQRRVAVIRLDHNGDFIWVFTGDPGAFTSAVFQESNLVAAGRFGDRFGLMRFDQSGAPDVGFGDGGKALGPAGRASAVLDSGTGLIAAGRNNDGDVTSPVSLPGYESDIVVAGFTRDGDVQTDFGSEGSVVTDMGGGTDEAVGAILHPENKITVAGFSGRSRNWRIALARYLARSGVESVQLRLNMRAAPSPLELGDNLVYDMTISNESNEIAYSVRYVQDLPVGPDFVSYSALDAICRVERITGGESRPARILCDYAGLKPGESKQVQIIVAPNVPGALRSSGQISTTSNDGNSSDNSATVSTTVVPHEGAYNPVAPMTTPRAGHTAVLLKGDRCQSLPPPDWCGKVLVVGGRTDATDRSTDLYDPRTNTWTRGPELLRYHGISPSASVLSDGRVLVVGSPHPASGSDVTGESSEPEIWDPASPIFRNTRGEPLADPRAGHAAVVLRNGKVLIVGGRGGPSSKVQCEEDPPGSLKEGASLKSVDIFDPVDESFSKVAPLPTGRHGFPSAAGGAGGGGGGFTATLLPNGKVLVVGGHKGEPWSTASPQAGAGQRPDVCDGKGPLAGGDVYDPVSNTWSEAQDPQVLPKVARQAHTATLLKNGNVLIVGGNKTIGDIFSTAEALVFDPDDTSSGRVGTWKSTDSLMINDRVNHAAALLESGKVLITGGASQTTTDNKRHPRGAELYNPMTNRFEPAGVTVTRRDHTATALGPGPLSGCSLNCGKILLVGGHSTEGVSNPDPANPVITPSDPLSLLGPQQAFPVASADVYTSPPSIDQLNPPEGPLTGNTEVVISGAALTNATRVTFEGQPPIVCGNKAVAKCWVDEELPDLKLHVVTPPRSAPALVGLTLETLPGMTASSVFRYLGDTLPPDGGSPDDSSGSGRNEDGSGSQPPQPPISGTAGSTQSATNLNNSQVLTGPPTSSPPQLVPSEATPVVNSQPAATPHLAQQTATSAGVLLALQGQTAYNPAASEEREKESEPAPRYLFATRANSVPQAALAGVAGIGVLLACLVCGLRRDLEDGRPAFATESGGSRTSPRAAI